MWIDWLAQQIRKPFVRDETIETWPQRHASACGIIFHMKPIRFEPGIWGVFGRCDYVVQNWV